jgi:Spy/CpxP family protein refolding chaperone
MKRTLIAAALLAAGLSALPVLAQGPGQGFGRGGGPGGPGGRGPGAPGGPGILGVVQQLDLTDAQRDQLRELIRDGREGDDPGETVRAAEQKLHAAILADPPDLQAIEGLKAALNSAHAAGLNRRIEMLQRVAKILTPAQRQELAQKQTRGPDRGRGRGAPRR